ncbi:hypothetical protein RB195_012812 [Necator americanus]
MISGIEDERFNKIDEEHSKKPINPMFIKTLNTVLMKFLRDVATVVRESPVDADQMEQADVSQLLAKSLSGMILTGSTRHGQPQRRLPPKVPPSHVVPLETAFSLGNSHHNGIEQGLTYWNGDGRKNQLEEKGKDSNLTKNNTFLPSTGSFPEEPSSKVPTAKIPTQTGINREVINLNRRPVPLKTTITNNRQPSPMGRRRPLNHFRRRPLQRFNGYSTSYRGSRLNRKPLRSHFNPNAVTTMNKSIFSGNRMNRKENLPQYRSTGREKISKAIPSKKDHIVKMFSSDDLTQTISQQEKRILPDRKLTSKTGMVPSRNNPSGYKARPNMRPKQELRRNPTVSYRKNRNFSPITQTFHRQATVNPRPTWTPSTTSKRYPTGHSNRPLETVQQFRSTSSSSPHHSPSPPLPQKLTVENQTTPKAVPPGSPASPVKNPRPSNRSQDELSPRQAILNDMIFDLFTKFGVKSFLMKTDEGTLKGDTDPKHTQFVPLALFQFPQQKIHDKQTFLTPQSSPRIPTRNLHGPGGNDLRVAVSEAHRNTVSPPTTRTTPSMKRFWTAAIDESVPDQNPLFFRNSVGTLIPWKRTFGVTRKQLRALLRTYRQ